MADPVRILIADDSATARFLLSSICREDPGLEVVREVSDGRSAVAETLRLRPDIVVMDFRMPGMDGFAATQRIMIEQPTPVLVVTASADPSDVALALRATEAGAVGVAAKPKDPNAPEFEREVAAFIRRVKSLARVKVIRRYAPRPPVTAPQTEVAARVDAIAIAASTGGPVAIRDVLRALPKTCPVPVAVVQHIAAGFVPGYVKWLGSGIDLAVKIAEQGEAFRPGHVYVAAEDRHLLITRQSTLELDGGPPVNGFRPSASVLFGSLATAYGRHSCGVILTGLGRDGMTGLREVHRAGGCVLAQDPRTAVAPSMPASVTAEALATFIAPVEALGAFLAKLCLDRKR